jgi:hypothetical protein
MVNQAHLYYMTGIHPSAVSEAWAAKATRTPSRPAGRGRASPGSCLGATRAWSTRLPGRA